MYRPKDGHQNMPNRHCISLHTYPVGARVRQSRRHLQRAVALLRTIPLWSSPEIRRSPDAMRVQNRLVADSLS